MNNKINSFSDNTFSTIDIPFYFKNHIESIGYIDNISIFWFVISKYYNNNVPIAICSKNGIVECNLFICKRVSGIKKQIKKQLIENKSIELESIKAPIMFIIDDVSLDEKQIELNENICIIYLFNKNHHLRYRQKVFSNYMINRMLDNYIFTYKEIFQLHKSLNKICIVCKKEKEIIESFNNRIHKETTGYTLVDHFIKWNDDKEAIVYGNNSISYKELQLISDHYASILMTRVKEKRIGLIMLSDPETVVAILSILKSGKSIVTINPTYPNDRISEIIKQTRIKTVFVCKKTIEKFANKGIKKELVDIYNIRKNNDIKETPYIKSDLDDLCYITYTSGSTGHPKGVKITHRNILTELIYLENYFKYNRNTKSLHILNYSFDFGLYDILMSLFCGGTLYSLSHDCIKGFSDYVSYINEKKINNINATPTFMNIISSFHEEIHCLKIIHLGGEKVSYPLIYKIVKVIDNKCKIFNGYGPCECTVGCLLYEITEDEKNGMIKKANSVPIGKPTDDSYIHILDENLKILPIDAIGEICVTGTSVGLGYINKKDEKDKFVRFNKTKLYRTGDIGKWMSDGNVEFIGRNDSQVKINGFRVELSEIDNVLLSHSQIIEVITILNNSNHIISYIVPKNKTDFDINKIRSFLSSNLPPYMIPSKIIIIDRLPKLASGKIDIYSLK